MEQKAIIESVKAARDGAKKRGFSQSFDLAVAMKGLDLKKPDHRIKDEVVLPNGRGKDITIAAFAEGEVAESAKKAGIEKIISKDELIELGQNKREAKKLSTKYDFFIAQPDLMVEVGKNLGAILAPRGKMPKPVPPAGDLTPILARLKRLVNVKIKDQPVLHCIVGGESMEDEQITQNIDTVLNSITKKLPRGEHNIRSIFVKLTMGPAVRIGFEAKGKAPAPEKEEKPEGEAAKDEEKTKEQTGKTSRAPAPTEEKQVEKEEAAPEEVTGE